MLEITGHINNQGKFVSAQGDQLNDWFRRHNGKNIILKIQVQRKKRSNDQNEYYWGVVVPMVQQGMYELGNEFTKEDVHEILKSKFNCVDIVNKSGISDTVPNSTAGLTTVEFMEYIEKIQRFSAEFLGVVIPDPNSQTTILIAHHDKEVDATIVEKVNQ